MTTDERAMARMVHWQLLLLLGSLLAVPATTVQGADSGATSAQGGSGGPVSAIRKHALTENSPLALRCAGAEGSWCKNFAQQELVTWRTAPRGDVSCPNNCNGVGRCNHDIGYCDCPVGTTGVDCSQPQKRPCTNRLSFPSQSVPKDWKPVSHIGPDMRDIDIFAPDTTNSRCAGICDDDMGMCYCDGPFGRVPPAPGSKPGSPPIKAGRPMVTNFCQPAKHPSGKAMWGERSWDEVYGPNGWCNASKPEFSMPCVIDGLDGPTCEEPVEHFCPGQCAGHGLCVLGFCKCDEGYYGHDCARRRSSLPAQPSIISERRWLSDVVGEVVAAMDPPPAPTRKRPLIYVYDLEPLYQSKMMQLRIPSSWCVHRRYTSGNHTINMDMWVYASEVILHEQLLTSPHRTFDPEEADYFYVPHAATCYAFPVMYWADWPWFHEPNAGVRPMHMANIILDTKRWIQKHFPFWDRRGGRDHIWFFAHDEGACWAPNDVTPSVWLTHWGRLGKDHKSQTAFWSDDYSRDLKSDRIPLGWHHHTNITGHACYRPGQDLVVPSFKAPAHYKHSALLGRPTRPRDIFLLFKGNVGKHRKAHYSRGVRQQLYKMATEGGWKAKHAVYIGDGSDLPGDYSDQLSRSKFCAVIGGDGWSARAEDAILHGCIPVSIQDGVHITYQSILDFSKFGLQLLQTDVPRILEILQAIPERQVLSMQAHLGRVWHRFRWANTPYLTTELRTALQLSAQNPLNAAVAEAAHAEPDSLDSGEVDVTPSVLYPRPFRGDPATDDAFATVLQWLHSRIPFTR